VNLIPPFLLLACLAALPAGAARAESLEDVLRAALANHPRAQAAAEGLRAAGFQLEQARAARFPRVAVIADPGRLFGTGAGAADVGELGVQGSVLVYDGGRTREAISFERSRAAAAGATADLTTEELAGRVVDVYVEGFKQERLAAIAADNVAAHEALYGRVREIVEIDRGRASDLTQVGARLEQARLQLAARRGAASEARALLATLAGVPVGRVEPPRDVAPELPATIDAAVAQLDAHPSLRIAESEADAREHAWRSAEAWARPRLDLQGTVNSPLDVFGERRYFDTYDLRLAVSWAPWDGGGGRAAARAAEAQLRQARAGARAVHRELAERVTELWAQIDTRRGRADSYRVLVEQSVAVREAYWQQFTIGRRSIIDLLNAENEAFQSRLGAENERLELLQARYRLLAATARLTNVLGVAPSEEPSS
jgi:adhesin transport system outer membrane protein